MTYKIRPAVASDIPTIASIDFSVNNQAPITQIPWLKPADGLAVFTSRYEHFFAQPYIHMLVAVDDDEILGFVIWADAEKGEEWQPDLPEGTNLEFFKTYLAGLGAKMKELGLEGMADLEALGVAEKHQRKGIGRALMDEFVKELDKNRTPCYLRSSVMGKSLYERLGWKVLGEHNPDLREFGWDKEYLSWFMVRDARSKD